jgi:two-component system chemotaxis response regulator CheY
MKVLVVDDDVVSRMVLMHLIDSCGDVEILEAEDGEHGWEQLDGGLVPAIVFCDQRMPRLSGMELLARVRADARFAALPFVLVSAANDSDSLGQAGALGASGYIVKPFRADQVRAHLTPLFATAPAPDDAPQDTLARLGIDAQRLLVYLGGLQRQLAAADAEIGAQLAGDAAAAHTRIARLGEGCAMLGLHAAAHALAALEAPGLQLDVARVGSVLAKAASAALRQSERVREFAGAA